MKYSFVYFIFCVFCFLHFGCKSKSNAVSGQEGHHIQKVTLSEEQQRKFDYFFYEANREKMLGNLEKAGNYYLECLKIDQNSAASLYEVANIYITDKQYIKAQSLLERAVIISPENIWYNYLLAELYQQNKNVKGAITIYERLVNQTKSNEEYLFQLSQLYFQEKRYNDALMALNRIEKQIGINETVIVEKQKIYLEQGKGKEAIKELVSLTKRYPGDTRYLGYLGDIYLFYRQFDNAEASYKKILDIDPAFHLVYFSLSNLYIQKNDTLQFKEYLSLGLQSKLVDLDFKIQKLAPFIYSYRQGKGILKFDDFNTIFRQLLVIHETQQRLYHIYGEFLKDDKKNDSALEILKLGILLDESNEQLWQDILFLTVDKQDFNALVVDSESAIAQISTNPLFYLLNAVGKLQTNRPSEAVLALNKGLIYVGENNALKSQFYANLGDTHYKIKNTDSAFYYYEEALKINEKNLLVLNNYGYFLALEGKDLAKAERMSSKCVEFEPSNSTYLDTYAWILFKRGRYLEAKFIIERAIDNGGDANGVIVEHYGDILYFNGDNVGALREWTKALELSPEDVEKLKEKISKQSYIE